ncbi:hypothetical protein [Phenylobacterium sp.]|jgi:hypothetical protein|uniref:hypothetical protein n=1 Tax=Phenylobacterium sp. TaxID=1871053 RepID=UPI002F424000
MSSTTFTPEHGEAMVTAFILGVFLVVVLLFRRFPFYEAAIEIDARERPVLYWSLVGVAFVVLVLICLLA